MIIRIGYFSAGTQVLNIDVYDTKDPGTPIRLATLLTHEGVDRVWVNVGNQRDHIYLKGDPKKQVAALKGKALAPKKLDQDEGGEVNETDSTQARSRISDPHADTATETPT